MLTITRRAALCGCLGCAAAPVFKAQGATETASQPDLVFDEIAPGVWLHTSWNTLPNGAFFSSNGMVVVGRKRVLMVDTAWDAGTIKDQTPKLLGLIAAVAEGKPIDLFVSHFHDDRLGGIAATAARGIASFAFDRTVQEARRARAGEIDNALRPDAHVFDLGGRAVEVFYPGPGHTIDNAIAYDAQTRVMFGGCLIRAAVTTDLGNTADAVVGEWRLSVARIAERYASLAIVIPGHGRPGDAGLLTHTMELAARQPAQ
jgi:glyoxylase-like metal-dependent hydrolase (beta-lactamase superfamily II)